MNRKEDFEELNQEIFSFFNSEENRNRFTGESQNLSIYDIQHLIYRHIGKHEGIDRFAISKKLKNYLLRKEDL